MEESVDLEIAYEAAYDPHTGKVLAVGPRGALVDYDYVISVDSIVAEEVLEGSTPLHHCFVDFETEQLDFVVAKPVENKIDDVLHRIVEWKWVDTQEPSVIVTYNKQSETLTFGLSTAYGGQYAVSSPKRKSLRWHGDSVMNFFATKYNDPHVCYAAWSFDIDALRVQNIVYKQILLPDRFSVFTRRLFDNYVLVIE